MLTVHYLQCTSVSRVTCLHLSRETGETAPKSAALYRTGAATGQGMAEPWRGPFDESDNDWIVHLFW